MFNIPNRLTNRLTKMVENARFAGDDIARNFLQGVCGGVDGDVLVTLGLGGVVGAQGKFPIK